MSFGGTSPTPRTSLEPICTALAQEIRRLRLRAGLSQEELARRSGLTRQCIAKMESGLCSPLFGSVARVAPELGLLPSQLVAAAERSTQL